MTKDRLDAPRKLIHARTGSLIIRCFFDVELKATERLAPHCERQLRNYLAGLRKDLGYVLHFGPKPRFVPVVLGRQHSRNDSGNP